MDLDPSMRFNVWFIRIASVALAVFFGVLGWWPVGFLAGFLYGYHEYAYEQYKKALRKRRT